MTVSASGAIDSERELAVAERLLSKFSQKCSHINNEDVVHLKEIKQNLETAKNNKHYAALTCMEAELSQIEGTHIVFRNLCSNVTELDKDIPREQLERLVVDTQRYDDSIRPLVQRMNDCLRVSNDGDVYIVEVSNARLENRSILERLDFTGKRLIFQPNRTDFR